MVAIEFISRDFGIIIPENESLFFGSVTMTKFPFFSHSFVFSLHSSSIMSFHIRIIHSVAIIPATMMNHVLFHSPFDFERA